MPPIDDRTATLNLPLPNQDNLLVDDVARLRSAMNTLDSAVTARQLASEKGAANGYASLDGSAKVPAAQLPSYVDDVVEYATLAGFPGTGETGKIYVAQNTNKPYRWSGSAYVEISPSPGSTDSVTEGSVNLYFTDARARAAQQAATTSTLGVVKAGAGLNVAGDGTLSVASTSQSFSDLALTVSTNGQTSFTVAGGYVPGLIDVFLNGAKLNGGGDDFTATNGTSLTLTAGANIGDTLTLRRWSTFNVSNTVSKSGDTLTGPLFEPKGAMAANNIDLLLGSVFAKTISGATTLTVSNVPATGTVASFMLDLTNGGSAAITWWTGIKWPGGSAPTLTAAGRDVLGFWTHNGGATWTGVLVARDVK